MKVCDHIENTLLFKLVVLGSLNASKTSTRWFASHHSLAFGVSLLSLEKTFACCTVGLDGFRALSPRQTIATRCQSLTYEALLRCGRVGPNFCTSCHSVAKIIETLCRRTAWDPESVRRGFRGGVVETGHIFRPAIANSGPRSLHRTGPGGPHTHTCASLHIKASPGGGGVPPCDHDEDEHDDDHEGKFSHVLPQCTRVSNTREARELSQRDPVNLISKK